MIEVAINPREIVDLRATFARAGRDWPVVAQAAVTDAVDAANAAVSEGSAESQLLFRGVLARSIRKSVKRFDVGTAAEKIVGRVVSYARTRAIVMDLGRAPSAQRPSAQALAPWVTANIGSFSLFLTKRGKSRKDSSASA